MEKSLQEVFDDMDYDIFTFFEYCEDCQPVGNEEDIDLYFDKFTL